LGMCTYLDSQFETDLHPTHTVKEYIAGFCVTMSRRTKMFAHFSSLFGFLIFQVSMGTDKWLPKNGNPSKSQKSVVGVVFQWACEGGASIWTSASAQRGCVRHSAIISFRARASIRGYTRPRTTTSVGSLVRGDSGAVCPDPVGESGTRNNKRRNRVGRDLIEKSNLTEDQNFELMLCLKLKFINV